MLVARHRHPSLQDGQVRGQEGVSETFDECEDLCGRSWAGWCGVVVVVVVICKPLVVVVVEIVKEYAADPARFATMGDVEIFVAPRFERGVERGRVLIASVFERRVEVRGVVVEQVRRGEIGPASEPPRDDGLGVRRGLGLEELKVPIVGVHGGRAGVPRVDDQADPGGEERQAAAAAAS